MRRIAFWALFDPWAFSQKVWMPLRRRELTAYSWKMTEVCGAYGSYPWVQPRM
eukprot:CAMPEP_0182542184 /NCGR_PEP_ID=MMETSP1323-20130603/29775_1 /TAXON_ID=236787 /ORGANISM="Florenciella parvula, Strain RCC1693" /LENGTH=52 /DNA_ID=CAMNT_0024753011 /DNA_START=28 /DNA_END=183 /DNA_ORIENTATION=+